MIAAGIDIGTNTILMVVGRVDANGELAVLRDEHAIARLGEGLQSTGSIADAAIERGSAILGRYADILAELGVEHVRAVATSAMRDARNASNVRARFETILGTQVDVISGQEEAALTYTGAVENHPGTAMVVDIGGGSTECSYGDQGLCLQAVSVDVGVVRLTDSEFFHAPLPLGEQQDVRAQVAATFAGPLSTLPRASQIVAVAGTPVALAALELGATDADQQRIQGTVLTTTAVTTWSERLLASTSDELRALPGIHPRRADVLPAGALILSVVLQQLQAATCVVSTRGLRYGALMSAFRTVR